MNLVALGRDKPILSDCHSLLEALRSGARRSRDTRKLKVPACVKLLKTGFLRVDRRSDFGCCVKSRVGSCSWMDTHIANPGFFI